ncbi:hypothetical protein PPYR_02923 [Photinus pyralis]|uniref:Phosphatidylinositol N-acetylglucosaminyltransferase subunit H conserved domain-containing protein n=1 Tax=Photinus pyralis TaxID=7054 RepID=A0A5N4A1B9_PHOPY|nr:phosphatidylinositol N-acetylglucosaminyltransferase subunit H-like [Photinus pyralis]XP_031358107.1 phosphatidylinositol N-acetylglucosaminyltransferase subunit H-like [Photinus pyralis]KAB0790584.1 hypothetical protein PPYR_15009 [Photinus pyralis]KAB0791123.1 hypothetical protein PPYR_02923 [Photinus pyralis]
MPISPKCTYVSRSKNIQGREIILHITQHDKITEITVKYASTNFIHRQLVTLSASALFIHILMVFQFINLTVFINILCLLIFYGYILLTSVHFEKVIIVENLGYQFEEHYNYGRSVRFVSWDNVKSVFINEVLSKQRVLYILAVLVSDDTKTVNNIIPLFKKIMPRLQCLEFIYRHIEHLHN